ncbi:MAG: 16S rRNA (cytosine(1402)-N(4))-methyltransferase, partial [Blastocatellia bacterium]|nr:16S rRNA (cytosine(1402)-N(4))-methyltransferase [Blastocatellia bacterium]
MSGREPVFTHRSVLLDEILDFFSGLAGETIVDATLGLGGHTEAILEALSTTRVIGIDQDAAALSMASERLARFGDRFEARHANFSDIAAIVEKNSVAGIIADLGVSS